MKSTVLLWSECDSNVNSDNWISNRANDCVNEIVGVGRDLRNSSCTPMNSIWKRNPVHTAATTGYVWVWGYIDRCVDR